MSPRTRAMTELRSRRAYGLAKARKQYEKALAQWRVSDAPQGERETEADIYAAYVRDLGAVEMASQAEHEAILARFPTKAAQRAAARVERAQARAQREADRAQARAQREADRIERDCASLSDKLRHFE
jgi:hypothetical protein